MNESALSTSPARPVSFRGEVTLQQFNEVQKGLLPVWARFYVSGPLCVFLFVALGVGWPTAVANPAAAVPDMAYGLLALLGGALATWMARKKAWQANAQMHGEVHGYLTQEGLEWNTSTTSSKFPWSKLLKYKHSGDLVLVFYSPRCAFYFPRSFFAGGQEWRSFLDVLALHLKKC